MGLADRGVQTSSCHKEKLYIDLKAGAVRLGDKVSIDLQHLVVIFVP